MSDDLESAPLTEGIALCLSGGGYRAMLFHLGVLWYLNDARYLKKITRFSSVSGGSITSGTLASRWTKLGFDANGFAANFVAEVVTPIRGMAGTTIDVGSVLGGIFGRGSISDRVRDAYDKHLFNGMRLDQLPAEPRFVINATNVQTGSLVRFSQKYIADYRVGQWKPNKLVAEAVTASSAFPPVLSPVRLKFAASDYSKLDGATLTEPPYTTDVVLTDGGVYDNMGIETAKSCMTILVSDAGAKLAPEEDPHGNPVQHGLRVNSLIDNQVRSLRKREVVGSLTDGSRKGAFWAMYSNPAKYPVTSKLALPAHRIDELAKTPTRLAKLDPAYQERLINFGYAMAERAMRAHAGVTFAPEKFPYDKTGV
jgi:NTE family protein